DGDWLGAELVLLDRRGIAIGRHRLADGDELRRRAAALHARDGRQRHRPHLVGGLDGDGRVGVLVLGGLETSKYENPHATITVKTADKVWTVTLAPVSRMQSRGAPPELVAVGKTVAAYGYPSTVEKDELRAEPITVDGKTVEMR